jgi:hypothetical protein
LSLTEVIVPISGPLGVGLLPPPPVGGGLEFPAPLQLTSRATQRNGMEGEHLRIQREGEITRNPWM